MREGQEERVFFLFQKITERFIFFAISATTERGFYVGVPVLKKTSLFHTTVRAVWGLSGTDEQTLEAAAAR